VSRIHTHPILNVAPGTQVTFLYEGTPISGEAGFTIAAALHQAGFPVHSHSLSNRTRSLECGIGKCGACEMLVDGVIRRICITRVDGVREVREIPRDYQPSRHPTDHERPVRIYQTDVAIIGAGPAGLAARGVLRDHGVSTMLVDGNDTVGGQFPMQTHRFFFYEEELKLGGLRGAEIARNLAADSGGGSSDDILLNSTVWDLLGGRRLAVKNLQTGEICYIDAQYLIVATGAVPFMPPFENDDMPGVYTAAVVQKLMNTQFTLLGRNVLTVGAGNIGYLTSYQLVQAGANVRAIIEARPTEGGFPVQANRVRRLGIPILLSHVLLEAIPSENHDGIVGAVIAQAENYKPVPGTEKRIYGIDAINICTGLVPDNQLLEKGYEVFGRDCFGAGDAVRIGEGTSAVLRGRQVAYEIMDRLHRDYDYDAFLTVSKQYIDSQQKPVPALDNPDMPAGARLDKPFVLIDCTHGFACNPCAFACPYGAITKGSTSSVPEIDFDTCIGCMKCVAKCPGLAIVGYDLPRNRFFIPVEFDTEEGASVCLVGNDGARLGTGVVEHVQTDGNRVRVLRVRSEDVSEEHRLTVRGVVPAGALPEPLEFLPHARPIESESYLCHCDDVKLEEILAVIGDRKFISIDEIKHTTRLGMGACRGKRCIMRLKQTVAPLGISVVGSPTPRAPLSNQLELAEIYPQSVRERYVTPPSLTRSRQVAVSTLVAGGGIAGSALFRYLSQAGLNPALINHGHGASWRNIAGGRPSFSLPELSDIAVHNREIFEDLQAIRNIDFRSTRYVTFAHDDEMVRVLAASMEWSDAKMVEPRDFRRVISPAVSAELTTYKAALVTEQCWQATPGRVVDALRTIGIAHGGEVFEDCLLTDVRKTADGYLVLARNHDGEYVEYRCDHFINALGPEAEPFAARLGLETGLYAVKHQAFITRRLPLLGIDGAPLPMMIDRSGRRGFAAVYGQQLAETGQVIGCASPSVDARETNKNLSINSREFLEALSEVFVNWVPALSAVGLQAAWAGCYVEPRMIVDPTKGLFVGLRGQGFMLAQYLARVYVDSLLGKPVPDYLNRLSLGGDGLREEALK
jgi:glycine/D-amino acid oxidase-like deaminating enzyme/thioredoxin reductase/Fe-S-cluster-containing hydrogenase component 2